MNSNIIELIASVKVLQGTVERQGKLLQESNEKMRQYEEQLAGYKAVTRTIIENLTPNHRQNDFRDSLFDKGKLHDPNQSAFSRYVQGRDLDDDGICKWTDSFTTKQCNQLEGRLEYMGLVQKERYEDYNRKVKCMELSVQLLEEKSEKIFDSLECLLEDIYDKDKDKDKDVLQKKLDQLYWGAAAACEYGSGSLKEEDAKKIPLEKRIQNIEQSLETFFLREDKGAESEDSNEESEESDDLQYSDQEDSDQEDSEDSEDSDQFRERLRELKIRVEEKLCVLVPHEYTLHETAEKIHLALIENGIVFTFDKESTVWYDVTYASKHESFVNGEILVPFHFKIASIEGRYYIRVLPLAEHSANVDRFFNSLKSRFILNF